MNFSIEGINFIKNYCFKIKTINLLIILFKILNKFAPKNLNLQRIKFPKKLSKLKFSFGVIKIYWII